MQPDDEKDKNCSIEDESKDHIKMGSLTLNKKRKTGTFVTHTKNELPPKTFITHTKSDNFQD